LCLFLAERENEKEREREREKDRKRDRKVNFSELFPVFLSFFTADEISEKEGTNYRLSYSYSISSRINFLLSCKVQNKRQILIRQFPSFSMIKGHRTTDCIEKWRF